MMNWKILAGAAGIAGIALAVPAWSETPAAKPAAGKGEWSKATPSGATVVLKDQKGNTVGNLVLTTGESGIALSAKFAGLPPGPHAFHIHEKGVCEGEFASAGGHFNPGHAKHGILNDAGRHAGDLPNLEIPSDGKLDIDLFLTGVSLTPGSPTNLNDQDGSSFVVHAGPDDYKTDPTGNAGGRIACGVLQVNKTAVAPK